MPEVAGFASHWANNFTNISENDDQTVKENKALAVQLATHYLRHLRNIRANSALRYQAEAMIPESDLPDPILDESQVPSTPDELQQLHQLLSSPIAYGMDATNVTSTLQDILGDDDLFYKLGRLANDLGEQADAVPAVKEWIRDNYPELYQKLGLSNQELDTPPPQPKPQPPNPMDTGSSQTPGQSSGGVVSEELAQMLRIAGIRR